MARPIFIGNNRLLVGLNNRGLVHDFYFPYVGLENHTNSKTLAHKVGVWVDGSFSWIDDKSWSISQKYEVDAQIGLTFVESKDLNIRLEFQDFVIQDKNVFYRSISLTNLADQDREIRLFMHQIFRIAESSRGDTALYMPSEDALLDYKGNRAFVIGAKRDTRVGFDQHSIGNFGVEGKEGTWRDAEDGDLGGNNIEHGHVDSVIGLYDHIPANTSMHYSYWIACATDNQSAINLHEQVSALSHKQLIKDQRAAWHDYLKPTKKKLTKITSKEYLQRAVESTLIIKSHCDARGAIIASGDSKMLNYARDYYSYFWPRDGAYVVSPLIRLGLFEEAKGLFNISRDVMTEGGYLAHKYLPDRSLGSSWHPYIYDHHRELPIQEDETAIMVYMLSEYSKLSGDTAITDTHYTSFIKPACDFMTSFIDKQTGLPHASYELWEMYFLTSSYSTATVYAALSRGAEIAEDLSHAEDAVSWSAMAHAIKHAYASKFYNQERQYLNRGFLLSDSGVVNDTVIDASSLYGAIRYGAIDKNSEIAKSSLLTLEKTLLNSAPVGGVPRFENDPYHQSNPAHLGNPWFVTTLWYAQIKASLGDMSTAEQLIEWTTSKMLESGALPEQIHTVDGQHVSVSPLIWSHAEYLNTLLDIYDSPRF